MDRICEVCGGPFTTAPANVRAGNGRFCSGECFQTTQRTRVPRVCETCGSAFTAKLAEVARGKARFCSRECFNTGRRGPRRADVRHRMTRAVGHPLAPPSGAVAISRVTLYDRIGPGEHPCHWCGDLVEWMVGRGVRNPRALLVDHLDHDATNDDPANLVPSCNPCNSHRRHNGNSAIIEPDELVFITSDGHATRGVKRSCEQCDTEFVTRPAEVAKGKGRFCSRSCARRRPRIR